MKKLHALALALLGAGLLAGCASMEADKPVAVVKDGQLQLPAGYKRWAEFLPAVQRGDAKQVREIYMNAAALKGSADKGFPNGSVFVMENYEAQTELDGKTLKKGPDGKLVKGPLLRVFVMGKNAGWGMDPAEQPANGNWVYASYLADGSKGPENLGSCRACHAPLTQSKDFVHRYDEHFASKKAAALIGHGERFALTAPAPLSDAEAHALATLAR